MSEVSWRSYFVEYMKAIILTVFVLPFLLVLAWFWIEFVDGIIAYMLP